MMNVKSLPSSFPSDEKLKTLIAAPLPPGCGGIVNWSRIVRAEFERNPLAEIIWIDTSQRYRSPANTSLWLRLTGGSCQALRDAARIYRKMKRERPHIFHLTTSGGPATLKDIIVLWLAKRLGVRRIIHYRMGRLPGIFARQGIEFELTRKAMHLADLVIPLDRESENCIRRTLPEVNVRKLPNMVEIDVIDAACKSLPPPPGDRPLKIVFVGHAVPTKGLRELVSACLKLPSLPLHLEIIGPIIEGFEKELLALAAAGDQGNWIEFVGSLEQAEAIRHIARADIFVLPSYSEGMPNVILEAMACGRAILATTVGAVPEMLDIGGNEECGIVVAPREVQPLAAALERLMTDSALRLELGKKARRRAERLYSVPVACNSLVEAWKSILKD